MNIRPSPKEGLALSMLVFKLKHSFNEETVVRSLSFRDASTPEWNTLAMKVEELFFIPSQDTAIAYVDEEGDQIVVSSQDELADYYTSSSFCNLCKRGVVSDEHGHHRMRCTRSLKVMDLAELRQRVQSRTRTPSLISW
jgi:PB1 domain